MIRDGELARVLPGYLARQRWFPQEAEPTRLEITDFEVVWADFPGLVWLLVDVTLDSGRTTTFQIFVGLRPLGAQIDVLDGKDNAILGEVRTNLGTALAYDGLIDPGLVAHVLTRVIPGEHIERIRPILGEQSNTSIVLDERLIMKVFRRSHVGENPDVDVARRLLEVGFDRVGEPVAEWRRGERDLAVVRSFLVGGTEGLTLAMISLRDMYDSRAAPTECGGDFGPEARRLGELTAEMHLALARAYGTIAGSGEDWIEGMLPSLDRADLTGLDHDRIVGQLEEGLNQADLGAGIRVHGDYHLGQVLRVDDGWYVLDFEGEPERPLAERIAFFSPLKDVAGMLRSFQYAARIALAERGVQTDLELATLGERWEDRSVRLFLAGYKSVEGIGALLPPTDEGFSHLLKAFELDKAIYEIAYEQVHRPGWVGIPMDAVRRLLEISA